MFELVNTLRGDHAVSLEYLGAAQQAVAQSGISFPTRQSPSRPVDALIALAVPGMERVKLREDLDRESRQVRPLLLDAAHNGAVIAAHCSASWFLADAGMLDARSATISWWLKQDVYTRFPKVRWDASRLLVKDGRIYTCGGGFSGLEMGKALLREFGYEEEERQVRKLLVLPPTRHSQTPYEMPLEDLPIASRPLRERLAGLDQHDIVTASVAGLAEQLAISRRTLVRRFSEEMAMTPQQWLTDRRIAVARQLLETTDLPIAQVCRRAGYEDAPSFNRLFSRMTGMTPGAYRQQSR
jgi:AraC family transcriptional regulator, transcriptional activator FtrA